MRQLFILFALVFALVTTATATVVTTAVISDTNQVRGGWMTATLLAANAAWTGLVIALWTKRLRETHYARLLIVQRSRISLSRFPRYQKR
jgi:hypothetical protein